MENADLLKAIIGFLLGALSSYVGLYWKVKKELQAQYDKELRAERLKVYAALWKQLQPRAKYSRPDRVTASSLKKMSVDLRQWYFEVGGLFMSERTRDDYFALQDELVEKISASQDHLDCELSDKDFEALRKKGRRLRTATTIDVGSRNKPLIGDDASA